MLDLIKHGFEFLLFSVVVKYIVVHWVAEQMLKLFKKLFVKTERETALWIHYRNKAMNKGHQHKSPVNCSECVDI